MPVDSLWVVAALSALLTIGALLSFAITGRSAGLGATLRLAHSFACGMAGVAMALFLTSIAGWTWRIGPFVATWLALLPVAWRRGGVARLPPDPPTRVDRVLMVLLLLVVACNVGVIAWLALDKPVWSYDALSRWMFKAKAFFHDRSVLPYFADLERGVTQPHYPPLVSLCATFVYLVLGREEDRLVKALFVAVFVALLCGLYGLIRRHGSRAAAIAATALLAICPCFVYLDWPPGVGAHAAMADVPLALFTLLSTGLLLWWIEDGRVDLLFASFVLAGAAPWIKQEGALVLIVNAAVALLAVGGVRRLRRCAVPLLGALALAAAVFAPWYLFQRGVPVTDDVYLPGGFSLATLWDQRDRLPVIARTFAAECCRLDLWNLLWPIAGLALVVAPRKAWRNGALLLALVIGLHAGGYAIAYAIEDFKGQGLYEQKMAISLTRLFMHLAPLAALLIGCQLAPRSPQAR